MKGATTVQTAVRKASKASKRKGKWANQPEIKHKVVSKTFKESILPILRYLVKQNRIEKKTVTSGCGQGTMFGNFMDEIEALRLPDDIGLTQTNIVKVIEHIRTHPSIYKKAGSVHACAVFSNQENSPELIYFVEDVGRHNAVDAISGLMWLDGVSGEDLIFYTTGRLTSEMVIKGGQMGIPFLMTRSGVTQMGLSLAKQIKMTMLARCSGEHFLVYEGAQRIRFVSEHLA